MEPICLFPHGGSQNHGCEAIVRTTAQILGEAPVLYSFSPKQDVHYGVCQVAEVKRSGFFRQTTPVRWMVFTLLKKMGLLTYEKKIYYYVLKNHNQLFLSIGGDNYSEPDFIPSLVVANKQLAAQGCKLVLWGCSIEPGLIDQDLLADLQRYALITARESITYEAVCERGLASTARLIPDPAFLLQKKELPLPAEFKEGNTVGVNVSPLIMASGKDDIVYENYVQLLNYILSTTPYSVALIPHVVWKHSNDLEPLARLYMQYKNSDRVCLVGDHSAEELKGFIARCRFFIAARTHASIAAYSTCVPTLVLGYSVKSRGIAKDLFGEWENYVLPVQELREENALTQAFMWLSEHELEIKSQLEGVMPDYIDKAWQAKSALDAVRKTDGK